jgi:hypothetical protein
MQTGVGWRAVAGMCFVVGLLFLCVSSASAQNEDANISISPNGVNRVGQPHTLTAHVNVNDGSGFVNAPNGTLISFTVDTGPGGLTSATCTTSGGTGSCTVGLTSAVTGVTTVSAHTTVTVGNVMLTRNTDGTGSNSGPVTKRWVDAKIGIAPSATNRVDQPHAFAVTLMKDTGDGAGFRPAAGEHVDVLLIDSNGAVDVVDGGASTCDNAGANTDANGQCTIVFTSASTGRVTGHAAAVLSVAGSVPFAVATNGQGANSPDAVKTFVDARIQISPSATNRAGQSHTFSVFVEKDLGDGAGFVPAANEPVTVTLTNANGATASVSTTTCTTDGTGRCPVTFTSPTPGTVTGHASSTLADLGTAAPITVESDPDAVKRFVDARIHITPSAANRVGEPHTFTVFVEKNLGDGSGWVGAAGEPVTVTLASANGAAANVSANTCMGGTDATGHCSITFTSPTTGTVTGHASTTVSDLGVAPFTVQTDGQGPNGTNAVKTFVDARIHISPSATNGVGQNHTFSVFVEKDVGDGAGFVPAANEPVTVTLTNANGATASVSTNTCSGGTDATGRCSVAFTSATPGSVTGHASSTLSDLGTAAPITVQTDGQGQNGPDAVKTFVDANISISPNGVNRVNQPHTLTAHVNVNDGSSFVNAPDGTSISFTVDSGPGTVTPTTCTTSGGTGSCSVVLSSATTGVSTVSAHTTVAVGGVVLTRSTDGTDSNSGPATKRWVDARIAIAPSAANPVGQAHTFTVTLLRDEGDGVGFQPAAGEHIGYQLIDSNGAVAVLDSAASSCDDAGGNTDANGQCTIVFTSASTGRVTGHAASVLSVAGSAPITVATDGQGQNSTDAVKTFVDAYVTIGPASSTNPTNTTHTYTAHVFVNDGSGSAYTDAPNGTVATFAFVGPHVGSFTGGDSCTIANGAGTCTIDTTSASAGADTMSASTTVSVGGVSLTRTTGQPAPGHANGDNAAKTWVGGVARAKITIAPSAVNEVGRPHTFTVTLSKDTGGGYQPAPNEHVDVALTDADGARHTTAVGSCTNAGANTDANGQCTISFTSPSAGTVTGHASATLSVGGQSITVSTDGTGDNSSDAKKTFVDANIQIAPPSANNAVATRHTVTGHVNINGGSAPGNAPEGTTISFSIVSGPGSFVDGANTCTTIGTTGSCAVQITSPTPGTTVVRATTDVGVAGQTLHRATGDANAGDSADAAKNWGDVTVRTDILNAAGAVVTSVAPGTAVHDKVFVTRAAGTPASMPGPTGNVVFHRYPTMDCTGTAVDETVALTQGDPSTASSAEFAPTAGSISYKADYLGDANYPARPAGCEPLTVTPAQAPEIAIVKDPKWQVVRFGGTARFRITVSNVGNTVLTKVTVLDPLSPNCNRTSAQIPALASMEPNASVTYSCSRRKVRSAFDNVATATGTPPSGPIVTATDTAPVRVTKALKPRKRHHHPKIVSHRKPRVTR